jgi:hypothetical protein
MASRIQSAIAGSFIGRAMRKRAWKSMHAETAAAAPAIDLDKAFPVWTKPARPRWGKRFGRNRCRHNGLKWRAAEKRVR